MKVPQKLLSDDKLRIIILLGASLVIGTSVITQAILQMGGNIRGTPIDLSSQLPKWSDDFFNSLVLYPNGLPPYISSGGVYSPENIIFNIGFRIAGVLFVLIGIEIFLRTASSLEIENKNRRRDNLIALISSISAGISLFLITFFPFDSKLLLHVLIASIIFISIALWIFMLLNSRKDIDKDLTFRKISLNNIRRKIAYFGLFCFIFMILFVSLNMHVVGAIGEWGLMLSGQLQTLTLIPILNSNK